MGFSQLFFVRKVRCSLRCPGSTIFDLKWLCAALQAHAYVMYAGSSAATVCTRLAQQAQGISEEAEAALHLVSAFGMTAALTAQMHDSLALPALHLSTHKQWQLPAIHPM